MQKGQQEHNREPPPGNDPAAFLSTVLSYKNRRLPPEGHTVHGTACIQRLSFHTTIYITKHFRACQEKSGPGSRIFVQKAETARPGGIGAVISPAKKPGTVAAPGFFPMISGGHSRYIRRRRIRRAAVRPYSWARYSSAVPYFCRMVSSTKSAIPGSTPATA